MLYISLLRAVKSGIWEEWDECMDEEGDGEWEYYDDSEEEGLQPEPSVLDPGTVYIRHFQIWIFFHNQ